jgi:hypothetical protein
VHDDAIIAFLLFCLEIYQAEQQRKRGAAARAIRAIRLAGWNGTLSSGPLPINLPLAFNPAIHFIWDSSAIVGSLPFGVPLACSY